MISDFPFPAPGEGLGDIPPSFDRKGPVYCCWDLQGINSPLESPSSPITPSGSCGAHRVSSVVRYTVHTSSMSCDGLDQHEAIVSWLPRVGPGSDHELLSPDWVRLLLVSLTIFI